DRRWPSMVAGPSLRAALASTRLVETPPYGSQRALLRFEFECPSDGGGTKGPCLITPAHGTAFGAAALPPTFTWAAGGTPTSRAEFSATPTFAKPRVRSAFKSATAFTPDAAQWTAIKALAAPGAPIYWRAVGKTSTKSYPSADTYVFTVGP